MRYKSIIASGIFSLALVTLLAQLYYQQRRLLSAHQWVVHTLQVQENSIKLLVEVMESNSVARNYMWTRDAAFLADYRRHTADSLAIFNTIKELTRDNPAQQQELQILDRFLQQSLKLNEDNLNRKVRLDFLPNNGDWIKPRYQLNQEIKAEVDKIRSEENRMLLKRESDLQKTASLTLIWNIVLASLFVLVAGTLSISLYREWQKRRGLVEKLAQVNSELENRNVNLQEANRAISEADRLKTEFLSAMSHELRTPLNSIIGFTGLLRMGIAGAVTDEQRKQLGMINESAQHLLHLINDLLDLSRIESGRAEIGREAFDMRDVIADVIAVLTPLAEKKQLTLINHCESAPLPVISDRRKVYQILLNLVNNAIKFSNRGTIEITGRPLAEKWQICVSDQGIGIAPESLASLFQAFHQLDGTARRVYEGTGLGLYLSKKLVELLGGTIEAASVMGQGSKFCFTLPAITSHRALENYENQGINY